jgi:serine/threonine-protein kinase
MPMIAKPMAPTITSQTPLPGDLKGLLCGGSYEIVELLGEGGMGQVWRARSRDLGGKEAAVKILLREVNDRPEALARFTQEISAIGAITALKENNVVEVYDTGLLAGDGRRYMLMEFCSGGSLESLLAEKGSLSLELTFAILGQAASALAAAHEEDIVHRDFKPANILLIKKDGYIRVKLSDFGIAKLIGDKLDEALIRTQSMKVLGTADYMAPEQANPKRGIRADHRMDIYAFGVVLYRCITGRTPYASRSVADAIVNVSRGLPFKRPSELRRDVPPALDDLVMACLAHDRDERIQSIDEVMRRFAEAIPTGLALLPYVAPRFVTKEAAPTADTISDGIGPALTKVVSNTSPSTYGERVAGKRVAGKRTVIAAALAGLVFGGAAMTVVDRLGSSPEAPVLARSRDTGDASHPPQDNTRTLAEVPSSAATGDASHAPQDNTRTLAEVPSSAATMAASATIQSEAIAPKLPVPTRPIPSRPVPIPLPPAEPPPNRTPGVHPAAHPPSDSTSEAWVSIRVKGAFAQVSIDGDQASMSPKRKRVRVGMHHVVMTGYPDGAETQQRKEFDVNVPPGRDETIIYKTW